MADDTARALGAASSTRLVLGGKEVSPRPLSIRDLAELERICLSKYRRRVMEAYSENLDLIPEKNRQECLERKLEEISSMEVVNLPHREVYDPDTIVVTQPLLDWLENNITGFDSSRGAKVAQRAAVSSLEMGILKEKDLLDMTKTPIRKIRVGYVNWWVSGTTDGLLHMVWLSVRDSGISMELIEKELGDRPSLLIEISREIERLTAPATGNG